MKRTLLLLPAIACLSLSVFAQVPVDKTVSLQSVEIQGKRFGGLTGGEVKRLQVDSNLSGLTGTTADVFRLLPSVVTDIEGGITFRGSNNPGLLINGVPYGLLEEYSGDMLIQLPALFFDRVSMTSTPSIGLVPDGDAGILNLSSAVYTAADSPLVLTLGAGFQERYNAGAILNLHPGKFHIVGKYNYRREFRKRTFSKSTTNKGGTTVMNNNASARPDVHLADLSVGYDLTANDLITVYGLYNLMDYSRYGKIHNNKLVDGNLQPVMFRHRYNDQWQEAYAAEARWNHTFDNPKDRLDVVFNYNNFGYDEDNEYKNEKPETGKIIAEDNYYVNQDKNNYYLSVLYGKLFVDDWHLRVGYIGRFKDESYHAYGNKLAAGEWQSDPQKENEYNFNRRTNLLLAALEKKWGGFCAEAGVQGELNWQKIDTRYQTDDVLEKIPMVKSTSRFHLFPRLKLGYRTDKAGELALSYVQRVIRPYGSYLNVFTDRSDATHVWKGNPDLKDEMIHSVELSYSYATSAFRFSPSLYYRNKKNRIMDKVLDEGGNGTIWTKENIGHSQTFGFELSATWQPIRMLSLGLSGDIYRDEIDGRTIGYDRKKSMVCGDIKGSVNISITPTTELQLDGFYISDQLTPQGKIKHRSSVNAGISQYFMHRKLRANLSINNIFNGLEETTIVDTKDLQMTWQPIRMLSLGLSGDIYRDEIDGRTIGYDRKKSMVCGDIKGSVNISITPTTELQLDGFYISDQLTPQGKIKHRSSVNAGISQYFMHRKLRANLSINNIFNGLEETTIVDTKDLQMTQVRNRDAQVTWVTLTYNL